MTSGTELCHHRIVITTSILFAFFIDAGAGLKQRPCADGQRSCFNGTAFLQMAQRSSSTGSPVLPATNDAATGRMDNRSGALSSPSDHGTLLFVGEPERAGADPQNFAGTTHDGTERVREQQYQSFLPRFWATLGPIVPTESYTDPLDAFGGVRRIFERAKPALMPPLEIYAAAFQARATGSALSENQSAVKEVVDGSLKLFADMQESLEHYPAEYGPSGKTIWAFGYSDEKAQVVRSSFDLSAEMSGIHKRTPIPEAGWAVGEFTVPSAMPVLVQCSSYFMVDDDRVMRFPDIYGEHRAVNVFQLAEGVHHLYVQFFGPFWCDVLEDSQGAREEITHVGNQSSRESPLVVLADKVISDVVEKKLASPYLGLPVLNAASTSVTVFKAELVNAPEGLSVQLNQSYSVPIRSGQATIVRLALKHDGELSCDEELIPPQLKVTVRLYTKDLDGQKKTTDVEVSTFCYSARADGFRVTFPDYDGSVQQMWVAPPDTASLEGSRCPQVGCPVLLSLHGASVGVTSLWGRNYAKKDTSAFPYPAWLVQPSNRHAYGTDWEGPGFDNAMAAVAYVERNLPSIQSSERENNQLDRDRVLVTGHSMGGHGCLVVSGHDPDRLLGSLCNSAWTSQARYATAGGSALLDHKGVGVLRARENEWAADAFSMNLRGVPLQMVVGDNDTTVPPEEAEYMTRLVDSFSGSSDAARLVTLANTKHWYGQNIDEIVSFLSAHLQPPKGNPNLPLPALPGTFEFNVASPSSFGTKGNLKLLQLHDAAQPGRFFVRRCAKAGPTLDGACAAEAVDDQEQDELWYIDVSNVQRFQFSSPPVRGRALPRSIVLDGVLFNESSYSGGRHFCLARGSAAGVSPAWAVCTDTTWETTQRGGTGLGDGPLHNVLRKSPLCIVHGGSEGHVSEATYLANKLYFVSRYAVPILDASHSDADTAQYCEEANLIFIGGPSVNSWTKDHQCSFPYVRFHEGDDGFTLGGFSYKQAGIGLVAMGRLANGHLSLVVHGTDADGLTRARQRVPVTAFIDGADFMVLGPDAGWAGEGGLLAAGYLDSVWQLSETSSWALPPHSVANWEGNSFDASQGTHCTQELKTLTASNEELLAHIAYSMSRRRTEAFGVMQLVLVSLTLRYML